MGDMQTGIMALSQLDGFPGRSHAGFLTAYQGVQPHLGVFAIASLERCHILVDDGGVFTMDHDGQRAGSTKDAVEGLIAVDEHIACRRAHEELDAWHAMPVESRQQGDIVVGGAEEEGVVHVTALGSTAVLVVEGLEGGGLRHGVGHVEKGGHTTCRCRTALTLHVGLLGQPGLAEVHMVVDDAWQNVCARSIYHLVGRYFGRMVGQNVGYRFVFNDNGAFEDAVLVDNRPTFNQCSHLPFRMFWMVESAGSPTGSGSVRPCCSF